VGIYVKILLGGSAMMTDKFILLQKIEKTREKMISMAEKHPYSSSKVVELSKDLDHLLNKYNNLIN
jgi:hypothetical protein